MKVTIGIPTYNQAAYIEKAVQSALAQTYPFIEVIVADDGSMDDTAALMEKFCIDPRFRYQKNPTNLGRTGNYKQLLYQLATGDWYLNIDGDDYLKDTAFIADAVQLIVNNENIVAVTANCERLNERANTSVIYTSQYENGQVAAGLQFLAAVAAQKAQVNHATTLYKRGAAIAIDFYRLPILSSDFESIYRLLLHGNVAYLNRVAAVWRNHGNNTVLTKTLQQSVHNLQLPSSVAAYARQQGLDLSRWANTMRKNMIAAILVESKGRGTISLFRSFWYCLLQYPAATLKTVCHVKAVWKHLRQPVTKHITTSNELC